MLDRAMLNEAQAKPDNILSWDAGEIHADAG